MAMPERRHHHETETFEPFRQFSMMQQRMNELFNEMMPMRRGLRLLPQMSMMMPEIEEYETDGEVVVKAKVPGVSKDNLDVTVDEESVTIHGQVEKKEEKNEEHRYYSEITYGEFDRTVPLPTTVDSQQAQAHLENGMLEVRVPKKAEAQEKTKKVQIS